MSESIIVTAEYDELLDSIKRTLAAGQLRAARAANNVLVETYWQIGRAIVARQQEQGWGARVIERLSTDLRTARPELRGLSVRNLRYMAALATRWPTGIVPFAHRRDTQDSTALHRHRICIYRRPSSTIESNTQFGSTSPPTPVRVKVIHSPQGELGGEGTDLVGPCTLKVRVAA